jgi:pimeloyl-ACP methyl ester carboxylesterase
VQAVLLVHSGGLTSRQWRKLADQLAPRYRVIAPDLLGYGPDRWPVGKPFHFRDDVAYLERMLDEPAHLVGHSYGGLIAMQLALAMPARVLSLALYEPVAFGVLDEPADQAARESVAQLHAYTPDEHGVDEVWLRAFVDWWQGDGSWQRLAEDTKQAFRSVGWKLSQEVASLVVDRTDRTRYATITAPTLLLGGERTQPAERRVLEKLATTLPNAKLHVLAGLGHMGPITHASLVNTALVAHIDSVARQIRE